LTTESITTTDVVIFGGGVAGLWILNRLRQQGYQAILLESEKLGAGQTRFAQGIIHGGTKYALTGKLTASAEAVGRMPALWRDCLQGKGEIDLHQVKIISQHQYMWSTTSLTSRLSGFFASRVMKSRTQALAEKDRPTVFRHEKFRGQVYQLDEPVLDTATVIHALAQPHQDVIFKCDPDTLDLKQSKDSITINWQSNKQKYSVVSRRVVLSAGQGNESLLAKLEMQKPKMQRRPLHMVMLRGMSEPLYAHCLGASTVPRITITSHLDAQGHWVWYLGGQLAEEGVQRDDSKQIETARQEMRTLFSWLDFTACEWATLHIDRAEPLQPDGKRPDTAYVDQQENVMTVWPTKMALAPLAAEEVQQKLRESGIMPSASQTYRLGEFPGYAMLPWQENERWN